MLRCCLEQEAWRYPPEYFSFSAAPADKVPHTGLSRHYQQKAQRQPLIKPGKGICALVNWCGAVSSGNCSFASIFIRGTGRILRKLDVLNKSENKNMCIIDKYNMENWLYLQYNR